MAERISLPVLVRDESTGVGIFAHDPSAMGELKDRCPTSTFWKHAKGRYWRKADVLEG
jgi:hypothetical protein